MVVVEIVLYVAAVVLMVPCAVVAIEISAALLPSKGEESYSGLPRPRIAVLVPAHNEAAGIGATLSAIKPQLAEHDRLVVIADNCSDSTAEMARKHGATAIERIDLERRGKGYALDYGMQYIEAEPPDVVVIIDADCIVDENTIDKIARLAHSTGRPVQATYILKAPLTPKPKYAVSALAFMVKNSVRHRGLQQLHLSCLVSTGFAAPWSVIHQMPLASGNIVEDIQLSVDLALAGYPAIFCPDALVTGRLPQDEQAASGQRKRWEHGHLRTQLTQVPRLVRESVAQKRFDLLAIALDLSVPPLALLVLIWAATLGAALLAAAWGISWIPAGILVTEGILIFLSIFGAWAKFGRADIPVQALLAVPFYIIWKIPLYLAFLVRPETRWIRTKRDEVDATEPTGK